MKCAFCKTPIEEDRISFRDECSNCGADLHICLNCRFYDPDASRQCRETEIPETETDKDRRNLCEYFKPAMQGQEEADGSASEMVRRKLEELFK